MTIDRSLDLLSAVANHVVYSSIPDGEIIETAYKRYWRELGHLSKSYKPLRAKHKLLFPKPLYDALLNTVKQLNQARKHARHAEPHDNYIYPDTSQLKSVVEQAKNTHNAFILECRKYLGTDRLGPISIGEDLALSTEADVKKESD
ncbi:MAG: hypothetical protein ACYTEL_11660 [Planctomycetota bacterium]|jgi:hypothetical protein